MSWDLDAQEIAEEAVRRAFNPLPIETAISDPVSPELSTLGQLLCRRRSIRNFSGKALTREKIERLMLDAAGGVELIIHKGTAELKPLSVLHRTFPQSGGINAISLYLILLKPANDLKPGIYRLCPHRNRLHHVAESIDIALLEQAMDHPNCSDAEGPAAIFAVTADLDAKPFKYGQRGFRYTLIEVGCVLQNLLLSACDQDIAAFSYGGFHDDKLAELLRLNYPVEGVFMTAITGLQR